MFWANFSKMLFCLDFGHKNKKCDEKFKKNIFGTLKKNPRTKNFFEKMKFLKLFFLNV